MGSPPKCTSVLWGLLNQAEKWNQNKKRTEVKAQSFYFERIFLNYLKADKEP